jgi:hypothetical protein
MSVWQLTTCIFWEGQNLLTAQAYLYSRVFIDDDDHVDGMRLRLWTAAINGNIVIPSSEMSMENHGGMILTGSSSKLSGNPTTRVIQEQIRRNWQRKWRIWPSEISLFILRRILKHSVKSFDMGPTALHPLRRKVCCWFLSTLKIHRPRPGLNPRTLGPMTSMLTISSPRTSKDRSKSTCSTGTVKHCYKNYKSEAWQERQLVK